MCINMLLFSIVGSHPSNELIMGGHAVSEDMSMERCLFLPPGGRHARHLNF